MKRKTQEYNALQHYRYTVTTACNVIPEVSSFVFGYTSSPLEQNLNITYKELISKLQSHFNVIIDSTNEVTSASPQTYRNHLSTLNSYLTFLGKPLESRVGIELASGYEQKSNQYLSQITVAGRTKRDRRSHLNLLRRLFEESKSKSSAPVVDNDTELGNRLRFALARLGTTAEELAKRSNASPTSIRRWLRGAIPSQNSIPSLRRVETALELPRDELTSLVKPVKPSLHSENTKPCEIAYRAQLSRRIRDPYALPEAEMTAALRNEWTLWFDEKTSHASTRHYKGQRSWRLLPPGTSTSCPKLAMRGNLSCPTAEWALGIVRRYLGWIRRPSEHGGGGYAHEDVQTLAWFCQATLIEGYLKFLTERSDGLKHGGQAGFSRLVNQLTRPERGFLWWHPELRLQLPDSVRPTSEESWRSLCARTSAVADAWIQDSSDNNRKPSEPIASLLSSTDPLLPLINTVRSIEQLAASSVPGGVVEARHRRNALLFAFLASNPLRLRTMSTLTWLPNNQGNVYRKSDGTWRLRLESVLIKNGAQELRHRPYDVEITNWVGEMIDSYIEEFRPVILKGVTNPYFLVATPSERPWADLDSCVFELSKRLIPGCPGFGPHSIRHLVATAWLTKHPNDFLTVAELLNERLETVIAHYAHLKRDVSLGRLSAHIDELRARG